MAYTFGFIGTGNMGGALAKAAAKTLPPAQLLLSNRCKHFRPLNSIPALSAAVECHPVLVIKTQYQMHRSYSGMCGKSGSTDFISASAHFLQPSASGWPS